MSLKNPNLAMIYAAWQKSCALHRANNKLSTYSRKYLKHNFKFELPTTTNYSTTICE
jgi:hypothetical protein